MARWLLLRGLAREQRHWADFPADLAAATGGTVERLDFPGFGTERERASPRELKPIVFDLRRRWLNLDPRPDRVLGLSMGGMAALEWASRFPDDFEHIVTVNASSADTRTDRRFRPRAALRLARGATRRDPVRRELDVLRATSTRHRGDLELARRWSALPPPRPENVLAQLWAASRFVTPRTLATPTLVVAGARDRLVDPRCSERMARRLQAPLHIHPDAGHDLPLDAPEWLVELVGDAQ